MRLIQTKHKSPMEHPTREKHDDIMIQCPHCNREVPTANFTIHTLSCNRRHRQADTAPNSPCTISSCSNNEISSSKDQNQTISSMNLNTQSSDNCLTTNSNTASRISNNRESNTRRLSRRNLDDNSMDTNDYSNKNDIVHIESTNHDNSMNESSEIIQVSDVVNLVDDEMDVVDMDTTLTDDEEVQILPSSTMSSSGVINVDNLSSRCENDTNEDEWACPTCTLLNPRTQNQCEACFFQNPNLSSRTSRMNASISGSNVRDPDPVIRERLIPNMGVNNVNNNTMMGDGLARRETITIMDSLPSSMQTQQSSHSSSSLSSSSSDNAVIGGGALLGGILGGATAYLRGNSVSGGAFEGAFSGAVGGALYSEIRREFSPPEQNSNHSQMVTTTSASTSPGGIAILRTTRRNTRYNNNSYNDDASFLLNDPYIQNYTRNLRSRRYLNSNPQSLIPNVDQMSYEQLLQMFGDGSDHRRGASASRIRSLPSITIQNLNEQLPKDKQSCSICLENFQMKDKVRTLPCCHIFHMKCIDRWLKGNASCPICKHDI